FRGGSEPRWCGNDPVAFVFPHAQPEFFERGEKYHRVFADGRIFDHGLTAPNRRDDQRTKSHALRTWHFRKKPWQHLTPALFIGKPKAVLPERLAPPPFMPGDVTNASFRAPLR